MTRPRGLALAAVRLATTDLPPGPVRDRYRRELAADLWGMSWRRQLIHALSVLAGAPALRRALYDAGELEFPHSSLWCAMHTHHTWHLAVTDDGGRYRRCLACGADDDRTGRTQFASAGVQMYGVHPQ